MKGIILAGGLGTRLRPLTAVTNKHLLPVYDKPMIYYPIQTLVNAGINDIMIVTGGNSAGDFLKLLRNGKDFGLKHLNYTYQEGEGGIAAALGLCEDFADGEPVCVVLGDNIIERNICKAVRAYRQQGGGAKILLKEVPDPQRFGVPELDGRTVVAHRGEAQGAEVQLRRHRHLHVRRRRLRHHQDAEALGARRAGDHGRQQRLHRARRDDAGTSSTAGGRTPGTFESLLRASNLVAETAPTRWTTPRHVAKVDSRQ